VSDDDASAIVPSAIVPSAIVPSAIVPGAPDALEHPQLAKPLVRQSRASRNDGFEIAVTPANLRF
jgi:hypothetical protein